MFRPSRRVLILVIFTALLLGGSVELLRQNPSYIYTPPRPTKLTLPGSFHTSSSPSGNSENVTTAAGYRVSLVHRRLNVALPARIATTMVIAVRGHRDLFAELREFVGAVHFWELGRIVAIYAIDMSEDQLAEARAFEYAVVLPWPFPDADIAADVDDTFPYAVLVSTQHQQSARLCELDRSIAAGQEPLLLANPADDPGCASGLLRCFRLDEYFTTSKSQRHEESTCALMLSFPNETKAEPLPRQADKPYWCLVIATYAKKGMRAEEQTLIEISLPSLVSTLRPSAANYSFAVYLGLQVDEVWDDPKQRDTMMKLIRGLLDPAGVQLRMHRYALNPPRLFDIVYKYNRLMLQAHADGCDYMFQYSDDFTMQTPDWPAVFGRQLQRQGRFGTIGPIDANNVRTMTIGASGRPHIDIQGWFWPPRLKAWFADNYIQSVYGPYSIHCNGQDPHPECLVAVHNVQKFGQRYVNCIHDRVMYEEIIRSRARALHWATSNRPALTGQMQESLTGVLADFARSGIALTRAHQPDPHGCPVANPYRTAEDAELPPYQMEV